MATIRPFAAARPCPEKAGEMLCLPYDVMNREEAAAMASGKPASFLRVIRSEIDLPNTVDPYDPQAYRQACDNLGHFFREGWLIEDPAPRYYIYRQTMNGRTQTGLVGCVPIDDYLDGTIRQHELTRREKETDRIRHFDACGAHTEPVFLTFREPPEFHDALQDWVDRHEPAYELASSDEVGHSLWILDDPAAIERLTGLFAHIPTLYIADGHHRSASAVRIGQLQRKKHPDYTGEEEFNYFMAVLFPSQELHLMDYNRVVRDLNGYTEDSFLQKLTADFIVEKCESGSTAPNRKHVFTMFLGNRWYRLTAKPEILTGDLIAGSDVSVLQDRVLGPLLGIGDPRTDQRIDFVGGIRGTSELERRVREGMAVAFALYPISVSDLMAVSDAGLIMPPKSTWFEPKLGSGLFLHRFAPKMQFAPIE